MLFYTDDEIDGRLPSDLTNLDSAELRQWDNGTAINVDSSLASMSSVTMPVASTVRKHVYNTSDDNQSINQSIILICLVIAVCHSVDSRTVVKRNTCNS